METFQVRVEGQILEQVAKVHEARPRQVALRFLTRKSSVFTIPKGSSLEHVAENAGAANIKLTKEDIDRIVSAFPIGPSPGFPPW